MWNIYRYFMCLGKLIGAVLFFVMWVSCGKGIKVSFEGACGEPPQLSMKRVFPETGDVAEGVSVLWEVGGTSQCFSDSFINYDDNGQPTTKTLLEGKVLFGKTYPLGENQIEKIEIIFMDKEGLVVARETLTSSPFRVGPSSAFRCRATHPQIISSVVDAGGQFLSGPPQVEFLLESKKDGSPVFSQLIEVLNPFRNSSLVTAIPGPITNQIQSVRANLLRPGYHPFIFGVAEASGPNGTVNSGSIARCASAVFVLPIQLKPPQVWIRGKNPAASGTFPSKTVSVPYGTPVEISWHSANATTCEVSPLHRTDLGGIQTTEALTSNQAFSITCANTVGQATDSLMVEVTAGGQSSPLVDLKVKTSQQAASSEGPITVPYNSQAYLLWNSFNVNTCELKRNNGEVLANTLQETVGRLTPNIVANETYTIRCSGGGGVASDSVTVNVDQPPPVDHFLFLSSTVFTGNLGGVAGGDQKCKDLAVAAGMRANRPWKAILSAEDMDAKNRIKLVGPIYNQPLGGTLRLVDQAASLFGGDVLARVTFTEKGDYISGDDNVWTGTDGNGLKEAGNTCSSWSATTGSGGVGGNRHDSGQWLNDSNRDCTTQQHIYCISQ